METWGFAVVLPREWSGQQFARSVCFLPGNFTFAKWYCLGYLCQKTQLNKTFLLRVIPLRAPNLMFSFFQSRLWLGFFWYSDIALCPRLNSYVLPLLCLVKHIISSRVSLTMPVLNDSDTSGTLENQVNVNAPIDRQRKASRSFSCSWALLCFQAASTRFSGQVKHRSFSSQDVQLWPAMLSKKMQPAWLEALLRQALFVLVGFQFTTSTRQIKKIF